MRKYLIIAIMSVIGLAASAQQGKSAIGANIGFAPSLEDGQNRTNFELGVKYQYFITNPIRLEAAMNYSFESKHVSIFDIYANVHYVVPVGRGFSVYPLAGIGYASVDVGDGLSRFLFNLGIGGEYRLTSRWSIGLEMKYQFINNFSRFPIDLGVTYRF